MYQIYSTFLSYFSYCMFILFCSIKKKSIYIYSTLNRSCFSSRNMQETKNAIFTVRYLYSVLPVPIWHLTLYRSTKAVLTGFVLASQEDGLTLAESEGRLNVTSEGERKRERAGVYSVVPTEWREEGNSDVYKALCTVQRWSLKGLSHEIDLKNVDKNLQNQAKTRLVFKFFRGSYDFVMQKVYLLRLIIIRKF